MTVMQKFKFDYSVQECRKLSCYDNLVKGVITGGYFFPSRNSHTVSVISVKNRILHKENNSSREKKQTQSYSKSAKEFRRLKSGKRMK